MRNAYAAAARRATVDLLLGRLVILVRRALDEDAGEVDPSLSRDTREQLETIVTDRDVLAWAGEPPEPLLKPLP